MGWLGIIFALLFVFSFNEIANRSGTAIFFYICTITLPLSYPGLYKKLPRPACDLLRFFMGMAIVLSLFLIYSKQYLSGIFGVAIILIFWKIYLRERRVRKLKACDDCLEFGKGKICSGFKMQAEFIRQYENEASDFLLKSGYVPEFKKPDS